MVDGCDGCDDYDDDEDDDDDDLGLRAPQQCCSMAPMMAMMV